MDIAYPGSLSQMATRYRVNGSQIYWGIHELENVDLKSFVIHSHVWASDKNRVYVEWRPKRIDRESFKHLNPLFVKDKKYVYDYHGAISGADPETFQCLDSGLQSMNYHIVNQVWAKGYAKDKNSIYYHDQMTGNATPLKNADVESFVSYGNGFGRDKHSIYYEKFKLTGANPDKWLHLGKYYSTDQKKTYHMNRELKGVDPHRFRVMLIETSGEFATDGYLYFKNDREITREDFISNLESDIARVKKTHESFFEFHCKTTT